MRWIIALSLFAALGCGESHGSCGSSGAPAPTCLQGWSGSSACCLEADPIAPSCVGDTWMCPSGTFAESECGRVDSMCEGIDAGRPMDSGPPTDGGSCGGSAPICYQGWSGSAGCCLEGSTMSATCAGDWACPSGYFTASECARLDPMCEGVDAGSSGGPYDDCGRTSECQLVANTCCGVCGMASADDMAAIARSSSTAYYREVACPESVDGPVDCPDCPTVLNPYLVATCDTSGFRPACAQVDLGAPPYSECVVDADCFLATPSCCACGEIALHQTIAVNSSRGRDLNALLCDTDAPCPPCVPVFDPSARATCDAGVCTVTTM